MSVHHAAPVTSSTIVVAVDVGKTSAMLSATDSARKRVFGPVEFAMTRSGLVAIVHRVNAVITPCAQVKVGIEAAGHYHRPVRDYLWPAGWEVLEFNPAHVAEQRRIAGRRRVKTDAIDLEAITELVLAGRGLPVNAGAAVIGELSGWAMHRTRRVATRTATKNQLLGQLDRAFPGLTLALPDVLGTKIGRLVAEPIIMSELSVGYGQVVFSLFTDLGIRPNILAVVDNIETIKIIVQSGGGIAIVPRASAENEVTLGLLKALSIAPARNVMLSLFRRREPLARRKEAALLKLREMLKG